MEPIAPEVIATLKKQPKIWGAVNLYAETFLTPKRAARIMELMPSAKEISDVSPLLKQESPALLRQQLLSLLLGVFEQPQAQRACHGQSPLENHSLLQTVEILSERAQAVPRGLELLTPVESHRTAPCGGGASVSSTLTHYWIGLSARAITCSNWNWLVPITICSICTE